MEPRVNFFLGRPMNQGISGTRCWLSSVVTTQIKTVARNCCRDDDLPLAQHNLGYRCPKYCKWTNQMATTTPKKSAEISQGFPFSSCNNMFWHGTLAHRPACSAVKFVVQLLVNRNGCGSKPMVPFWGRCTTPGEGF